MRKSKKSKDTDLSKKCKQAGSSKDKSKWFKQPQRPPNPDLEWNKGKSVEDGLVQNWLNDLDNAENPLLSFVYLMSTLIDFMAFAMNRLKLTKLTKADLVRSVYNLLKETCKSCIELEYNTEECYRTLSDKLDWNNPEGDQCPYDLTKPLPLHGSLGHLTIPSNLFFNNDLEYLRVGNIERQYTTSITKTKVVRYKLKGIEDMVPKILSVVSVIVDKQLRYGYLKEIVVRRVDWKLYKFMEGDFPRLHLNDIEDMLLLHVQNKLSNLERDVIVDLVVALRMFTRRYVIQKRVKDLHLGVESYQKKLNIYKLQTNRAYISFKEQYTTQSEPQGVIYEDMQNRKRLMCTDELHKFNDGTLEYVRDTLDYRAMNFMLRRIMRNLERLVGGRELETDYRLMQWTI
ncbi:hypothetical protein Tco_0129434 [Tanacetum coccineum]